MQTEPLFFTLVLSHKGRENGEVLDSRLRGNDNYLGGEDKGRSNAPRFGEPRGNPGLAKPS